MAGKFVLKKDAGGSFRFNLVAGNGQVIASSQGYKDKPSALKGIESIKRSAPEADTDDQSDSASA